MSCIAWSVSSNASAIKVGFRSASTTGTETTGTAIRLVLQILGCKFGCCGHRHIYGSADCGDDK